MGGYLDFIVKNDVSRDTLEEEVFELEDVKVKIDIEQSYVFVLKSSVSTKIMLLKVLKFME